MKKLTFILIFVFSIININFVNNAEAQNKMFGKDKLKKIKPFSKRKFTSKTDSVELKNRFNKYRRQGTRPVRLRNRSRTTTSVELMRNNLNKVNKQIDLKTISLNESELPKDLIFSRIPKFPENPALLREDRDLKRVVKEAFDLELYWRYWDSINITLLTDGLNESISYYIIALKFKGPINPQINKEISLLKEFMKKIVGEEYVIHEKLPIVVIIASDMQGDDQFANVQLLGKIIDDKLNPVETNKKETKEVNLLKKTVLKDKLEKNTTEINIEKQKKSGK